MDYRIVKADEGLSTEIFRMLCLLDQEIGDPNYFVADDHAYVESHIREEGFILAAMAEETVAGFLIVDIPGMKEKNLGWDLGWPPDKAIRSVHMDTVGVLPSFRGQGLQKALILAGEDESRTAGYTNCLATVYPENQPSLQSFLKLGYRIGATKEKYGGVLRHILYKEGV